MQEPKFSYREVVRLSAAGGYSQREIAAAAGCSNGAVAFIQKRARESGLGADELSKLGEGELRALLSKAKGPKTDEEYAQPDLPAIQEELDKHRGLTLAIVWEEYAGNCIASGKRPYMYSQFSKKYKEWRNVSDISLRVDHVPGDKMEVDWAGTTMEYVDMYTGELHAVYLFVATLPYSQYTFVKPAESMDTDSWIGCNIAALRFFGGVPRIVVPDNLKTGVASHSADEVVINRTYREFAEHYGTAVIPTGVRKPKHKASVEGNVGKIGERIALMLRNQRFFSMEEVERAVSEKLDDLNSRPFKKRSDGSRREVYEASEKHMLSPLPAADYDPAEWCKRTVSPSYRVTVGTNTYTVPYAFAGQVVDVRVGRATVEVFCDSERIATHPRSRGRCEDVKQDSHQPKWHTDFLEQSGERFRQRAADEVGPWCRKVADGMLAAGKVEEEGYRPCAQLLNLAERYGAAALEAACRRACGITRSPSLKTVKILLKSEPARDEKREAMEDYAILRGEDYYAGGAAGDASAKEEEN